MSECPAKSFAKAIRDNEKIEFPIFESNKSRFLGKLRYYWCWIVVGFLLITVAVPALIFLFLINKKLWLYPIALWGAKTWLKVCSAGVKVIVKEPFDDNEQFVFVANHRSYLDTATLFRYTDKRIGLVAKKELLKIPVFGQGMHFVNIFAIDRSNPEKARKSMEKARKVMENGYSFGVFAEGTRAMPGELLPFKKGAFHLAQQTGKRIIPVAIRNTDWMMGKKTGMAFPGTIEMILLPPVETDGKELVELLSEVRGLIAMELSTYQ